MEGMNGVAKTLFIIGGIDIFLGLVFGLTLGSHEDMYGTTEMNGTIFSLYFFSGFISGMLFIGFGEVVNLLDKINEKLYSKDKGEEKVEGGVNG